MSGLGDTGKITKTWIDIDMRDWLIVAKAGFGNSRGYNNKGNPRCVPPDRCLAPVGFLSKVPTVITGKYNHRVPIPGSFLKLLQQASDLNIHIVDACKVGLHHVLPFPLAPEMQNLFVHGSGLE